VAHAAALAQAVQQLGALQGQAQHAVQVLPILEVLQAMIATDEPFSIGGHSGFSAISRPVV